MTKNFKYLTEIVVQNDIQIEDIGECAILANNDLDEKWVLIISSELGLVDVFETGPIWDDMSVLPRYFFVSYKRIDYSESKISKIIDKFLNEPSRGITQAVEIDKEEAKSKFINLTGYIK